MFLRRTERKKNGKTHSYWNVVENKRLDDGRVVQRHVLYLGEINSSQERAWRKSIEVLDGGALTQSETLALFPEDRCEAVAPDESVVRLRLSQLRLLRPRQWGACWLACHLWDQLRLDDFWSPRLPASRQGTRWLNVLKTLVTYRLVDPGSEWRLHRQWYAQSAIGDLLGGAPEKRIDEVLEIVSLKGRDRDRVRTYSMGMKQRLGLGMALLNNPDVLILDEPANGLDPAGIVEMRDLLRDLAADGKTVFISSHVLTEVQQICTRVAIINHGKLVRVAPVHDLLQSSGEYEVKVDAPAELVALLRRQPWGPQARVEDGLVITPAPEGRGRNLIKFLVDSGVAPDAVSERQKDLEDIFLSLTGGD